MIKKLYTGDPDETCPLRGGKLCAKVCPTCKFQQCFTVTENATGMVKPHWDCALTYQTQLLMEGNIFTQGVGQAVETFRNETVERSDTLINGCVKLTERVIGAVEQQRLLGGERNGQRLSLPGSGTADTDTAAGG